MEMDRNEPSPRLSEQIEPAKSTAQKHAYSLTNPYTTQDEKVEIQVWYQLPVDLAGIAYIATCVIWSRGDITGWQAYVMAFAVGVAASIVLWVVYAKRIVFAVKVLVGSPGVWVVPHIGVAAWLAFTGAWTQAAFLAGNCVLLELPVGLGAILANQILTSRYRMHPKYAFLKHVYGKVYPFELTD
jgi:hypothetical protein